ncbi:DUF6578 domain-containing protein [Motilibacter aurantiacus]|uniref:DUF6578 domain-containing protein n=1 Tax=Motilibacter aurantiacus TaxID=2714955 RepID=UPI00140A7F4E|nr:DUF6578 domain-containing protein [Motilibacter aurantiacus]NHC44430.1 hypothetical protein [Motilibacter aurantiacus]
MDVEVEVGDWEHECCGEAIARDQLVDLDCICWTDPDGHVRLIETHHDLDVQPRRQVRGRVVDIRLVQEGGATRPLLRLPSGRALAGAAPDDGRLQDLETGEALATSGGRSFRVTVRTVDQ